MFRRQIVLVYWTERKICYHEVKALLSSVTIVYYFTFANTLLPRMGR